MSLSAEWNRPFLFPMASADDGEVLHREKMLFSPSTPLKTFAVSSDGPALFIIYFFTCLRFKTNETISMKRMDPVMTQAMRMAELGRGGFSLSPLSSCFPA